MMQRIRTTVVGGVALIAAAACTRAAPSGTDDALRADLDAAQAAAAGPTNRTQFVSAVELGREATPRTAAPAAVPSARARTTRVATARRARASAPAPAARPVARVRPPEPVPVAERGADDADVRVADRPAVDPAPKSGPDEPVVAGPSRRPDLPPLPPERRRGRVWDMGDVIRNAPFPINPVRPGW